MCRTRTPEVDAMEVRELTLAGKRLRVKVADSAVERMAGMQGLCPWRIREQPVLFLFPKPQQTSFHMHNVYAPLDIAFIDHRGVVVGLKRLLPDEEVRTPGAVAAVLEAHAGAFEDWGLEAGQRVRWDGGTADVP
jgi:uncharacterized membrane protein (UPF0127 family)